MMLTLHTVTINTKFNMRTKTLLLASVALAVSLATSTAQSVYSQNVVGYVNLNLTNGFNFIANQLDSDGTGTNNTLFTCFGTNNLPNATKVWVFVDGGWQSVLYIASTGSWLGNSTNAVNAALNPGGGVMVQITTPYPTNATVTFAGNVLQAAITNAVTAGFQVIATPFPISGVIDTNFGYIPSKGDRIYTWNPAIQNYSGTTPLYTGSKWLPAEPTITVGQPMFLLAASNNVWGLNFTVPQ
jgi:hypothetical protein